MNKRLAFIGVIFFVLTTYPALAQRLVSALSDRQVSIDSSFSGETITLFGNVEPETGSAGRLVDGPFNVVIVIRGPAVDRVARKKTRQLGIWLNTDQLVFKNFPSFFWVLSSKQLTDIATKELLEAEGLLPQTQPGLADQSGSGDPKLFGAELVRLMSDDGLFGVDGRGVQFRSDTLYSARVSLPADVPVGNFLAQTYLFKNGEIVSRRAEGFSVRKTGFERLLGSTAQNSPWLYGFACVFLAIFTGWLGGVAFRR